MLSRTPQKARLLSHRQSGTFASARLVQPRYPHLLSTTPNVSTPPPPLPPHRPVLGRLRTFAKFTVYLAASSALGVVVLTGCIFVHDAFTYTERHIDRVPVSPLALHPERGGPKKLPVASAFVGDMEDEDANALSGKPRLVVVGGGWGVSISFLDPVSTP